MRVARWHVQIMGYSGDRTRELRRIWLHRPGRGWREWTVMPEEVGPFLLWLEDVAESGGILPLPFPEYTRGFDPCNRWSQAAEDHYRATFVVVRWKAVA